ncbi:alkaline phosphatase D family protein [Novipirellula artificiosorum]|uniref:PhoD-like phosphatase n=1 Tax=Novipirellula artificiosorum TaxID=2528016 RepID=A0A5C6D6X6_9BACT|nr:alkaline phosphatase D family protein [Novipirellula artificiosorum]TWU31825.1 PhoD-like phosphatase [Novipirellula artificiosorum]
MRLALAMIVFLLTQVEVLSQHLDLLPLDHSRPLTKIALGSCAREGQSQPIWEAVADSRPDLFVFLGDNIYADTTDMKVMKRKYGLLAADQGFQRVTRTCPILATWDDHDYGADDSGEEYPKKIESQQVFLDFFGEPANSNRRRTPGIYDAKIVGPPGKRVQVILLDTRYFRGPLKLKPREPGEKRGDRYLPNPDAAVTMLGDAQWTWLEEQLRKPAGVRIIASSIQVINEDHDSEHWSQLPHERERLFKLIRDTEAAGVVFISGDVHRGELSTMDGGVGYPLFDLTSSGLNRGFPSWRFERPNRHRMGTLEWGNNFGMIVLEWDQPEARIRLQIRDEAGDIMIQRKIEIATLQPGILP